MLCLVLKHFSPDFSFQNWCLLRMACPLPLTLWWESIASSQVECSSMYVVTCATAVCPLLKPVCWVLCNCSLWNCGVQNMPAFFCKLCLLDPPTTGLVSLSSTAVIGAGASTVIETTLSTLFWPPLVSSAGGGVFACEWAFNGFEATPEASSSSSLVISTGEDITAIGPGGTKSTSLVMIIEWLQYTIYWFLSS